MKLQAWQQKEGVSNTALAKKLGVHVSYITHINKERRIVSPDLALRIEQLTGGGVTRDELLFPGFYRDESL